MKKILTVAGGTGALWMLPMIAFAQSGDLQGVVRAVGDAVGAAVPVAAALVLVAFFWGLALYLFNFGEGDDKKQKQGRGLMLYSILALFVMVTIWGIVGLLANSFDIEQGATVDLPVIGGLDPGGPGY